MGPRPGSRERLPKGLASVPLTEAAGMAMALAEVGLAEVRRLTYWSEVPLEVDLLRLLRGTPEMRLGR